MLWKIFGLGGDLFFLPSFAAALSVLAILGRLSRAIAKCNPKAEIQAGYYFGREDVSVYAGYACGVILAD
jgi:hypothetical protein